MDNNFWFIWWSLKEVHFIREPQNPLDGEQTDTLVNPPLLLRENLDIVKKGVYSFFGKLRTSI